MDLFVNLCWRKIPVELSSDSIELYKVFSEPIFFRHFYSKGFKLVTYNL